MINCNLVPTNWPIDAIRSEFPILQKTYIKDTNTKIPLVYLDNAATTQKPITVISCLQKYFCEGNANVHRGIYRLAEEATQAYFASRKAVANFIHAKSWREIIFTKGTTESINLVSATWGRMFLKPGCSILLSEIEHHSNLIPWQILAREKHLQLEFIPVLPDGTLDMTEFTRLLQHPIGLIAITAASNVFGTLTPVAEIIREAHAYNIPVLVDAAQFAPHHLIDVNVWDCDFLAFSGHKIFGPTGVGILYAKEKWLLEMLPYQSGGEMVRSVWQDHAEYEVPPYRFEAGTPPIAEAIALHRALAYLEDLGWSNIIRYEKELTSYTLERLQQVPDIIFYGPKTNRIGVFSFSFPSIHPHDIAQFLDNDGIAVRAGHHCAQPIMRKFGIPGSVRASLCFYNTPAEIDSLIASLCRAKEFFLHAH